MRKNKPYNAGMTIGFFTGLVLFCFFFFLGMIFLRKVSIIEATVASLSFAASIIVLSFLIRRWKDS